MRTVLLLALVACGSSSNGTSDAKVDVMPDLAPAPDAPPGHYLYIVDHETVPTDNASARMYALDLNNDGTVDNQFGMVLGALNGQGFDIQTSVNTAVDRGVTLLVADLDAMDFTTTTGATFTTYDGGAAFPSACSGPADSTCRHQLDGHGMFTIAANSAHDTPLSGNAVAGTFTQGPGHLEIEAAFFGSEVTAKLDLIGARVKLSGVTATNIGPSIVAGAITTTDVDGKLIPAWQMAVAAQIQKDCCGLSTSPGGATCTPPSCGCATGSTGKTDIALFDMNHDCVVTNDEIKNNSLVMSLLAPDVMIDGQQALSFGMQVTAVHAGVY